MRQLRQHDGAEDQEGHERQQLAFGFGELEQKLAVAFDDIAEGQPGDEGGDEAVAADQFGAGEGKGRHRQHGGAFEGHAHPLPAHRGVDQPAAEAADRDAGDGAEQDLQCARCQDVRRCLGVRRAAGGQGREQEHEGHGDAVIETAFHVERLTDAHGHVGVGDHGLAERRIGRREHRGEQRGVIEVEAKRQGERDRRACDHGQGHADEQHALRQTVIPQQRAQIDAGRVGEQDQHKRDLGECVDQPMADIDLGEAKSGAADDQAEGGEHHGCGDQAVLEPAGDEAEGKDAQRDDDKSERVHVPVFPARF